uniref:Uncharacterized protein n=2 Tax=Leptocylindrus danicus TaxID=163516 RepID=A0A7S2NUT0_9STRA|mmetsp:Transcript_13821/g.20506  ORF Transcript_13821/g.20506 Transcript_13821/m.20506 type:complete len:158 (+) Transcript_13821:646-1119(+)
MDLTMSLQALIPTTNDNASFDLKGHIQSRFDDADAVNEFLSDVRLSEYLETFAMVQELDVEVQEDDGDGGAMTDVPSQAPVATLPPTSSPTSAPVASNSSDKPSAAPVTNAPTLNLGNFVTGAPFKPSDASSDGGASRMAVHLTLPLNLMFAFFLWI